MRMHARFAALAALIAVSAAAGADTDKKYTLADLEELVSQKSYLEAVYHLGDVSPGDRKAEWLDVAADAAAGYIKSLSNDDLGTKVTTIEAIEEMYPVVLGAPKYVKVRNEVGLTAYQSCFEDDYATEICFQHALEFIEGDPGNTTLALKMAKLVRKNAFAYVAVPFFTRAVGGKTDAAACKDEDLQMAVIAGLGLPYDDDGAGQSRALASGPCWTALKKPILAAFKEGGSYVLENTCDFLKAKKALSAAQAKSCKAK